MAMSSQKVAEAQSALVDRLGVLCKMTKEELLVELPQVCGFKPSDPDNTKEQDLIYVMMKFAIFAAFPKK